MNENSFQIPKLQGIEVLKKAFQLYKDKFKLLIKLSFLSFIIHSLCRLPDFFQYITHDTDLIVALKVIAFFLLLPSLYYETKFTVAIYACLVDSINGRNADFERSMLIASEKFWRYVGVSLRFSFIIILPVLGILAPFYFINNLTLRWLMTALFSIPTLFLGTIYGLAPLIVIAENVKKPYFAASRQLVKGDFWKVALLVVTVTAVFMAPYQLYMHVFNEYRSILPVKRYIISTINQIFLMFTTPFSSAVYMVLYNKLKNNKRIG